MVCLFRQFESHHLANVLAISATSVRVNTQLLVAAQAMMKNTPKATHAHTINPHNDGKTFHARFAGRARFSRHSGRGNPNAGLETILTSSPTIDQELPGIKTIHILGG